MITKKLGRKKEHRERTMRNLATSIVLYEKVQTTEAKAKSISPVVERLLSSSLKGTLAARRDAKALLFDQNAVTKLFEDIPSRVGNRTSGFVRITKLAPRNGDGASMAQIELLLTPVEQMLQEATKTKVAVRKSKAAEEKTPKTEEPNA